ncbi:MAG TPA: hypothetical protein PKA58_24505 [Polyangium sp.]|nr:hypothetical protein [Polyangium sp.]
MKTFFSRRTLMLVPLACATIYGCETTEEELSPELADVLFEGATTDEALIALDASIQQKAPVADPTQAPVLDMPTATMLPKTPIPTFTWHAGAAVRNEPWNIDAPTLLRVPEPQSPFRGGLAELFGPIKAAHAHGDPLVGPATFLVFSTATNPKLTRVFTSLTSYTPTQAVWDKMIAANAEITLSLVGAQFDANRIADGGGPFQGTKFAFTITP